MWIGLVCLYGVLKGVRDIIKKKAMEKKQCYGGAVFLHVYKLFIRDAEREKRIVDRFSLYRICNDKIGYNFYSLDMQF